MNKSFKEGVYLGFAIFLAAQVISFISESVWSIINFHSGVSIHYFWDIGFPFSMYYGMFSVSYGSFSFSAFLGNLIVGIIFSFIIGLIFRFVPTKNPGRKVFYFGVTLGFIASLIIQIATYAYYIISKSNFRNPPGMSIYMIWRWGFPFPIVDGKTFNLEGLIGNILVTLIFSLILGLIFKFVWSKISARKLR